MKKKLFPLLLASLLIVGCGNNIDDGEDDHSISIEEGQEALLYSQNRLLTANYDFDIDFVEEDNSGAPLRNAYHTPNVRNDMGPDLYDISNLPSQDYDAFRQIRNYLADASNGAKAFVDSFADTLTILNTAVDLSIPHGEGDEIVILEDGSSATPKVVNIDGSKGILKYDPNKDEVTLIRQIDQSSISEINLSYDEEGREVVRSFSASAEGQINETIYIPDYYCSYISIFPSKSSEFSETYDGYSLIGTIFKKVSNYNWYGIDVFTHLDKEKIDNNTLTVDDIEDTTITLYQTANGHAYGVSLRLSYTRMGNEYVVTYKPDKISSGFMDYLFDYNTLIYTISEITGFDKMMVKITDMHNHVTNDCGEEYTDVHVDGGPDNTDYYLTTKNGKTLYGGSYIDIDSSLNTHKYFIDMESVNEDSMYLSFTTNLIKGVYEDLNVNSPDAFVPSPYTRGQIYFFTKDTHKIALNIGAFFAYFGLKVNNGHPLYEGTGDFLNILDNAELMGKHILEHVLEEYDTTTPSGVSNFYLNTCLSKFAHRNTLLHSFDGLEVVKLSELPKRPSAQLVDLQQEVNCSIVNDSIVFTGIDVTVKHSRLFFEDKQYTIALIINNKIRTDVTTNKVIYNGGDMHFSNESWSLPLPSTPGLYHYSFVLVKITNGSFIPISNIKDITINNFTPIVRMSDVDDLGGYYEYHYENKDGQLSVYSIYIEAEENE